MPRPTRLSVDVWVVNGVVGTAGFAHYSVYSTDDPDVTPTNVPWEDTLRELCDRRVRVTFETVEDD